MPSTEKKSELREEKLADKINIIIRSNVPKGPE